MVEPPYAEEFIETILSNEIARPPKSERAERDTQTMSALLNLLGKKHTIVILHQFATGDGPFRFSDLEEAVDIAPNTLSNRLQELTAVGLLTRKAYNEIPPRVEYTATEKAEELAPVFWYLGVWTERHDLEPISADGDLQ
ncbi:winged helix-turn-helix transcriptional regulator [Haloprofundus salinisoli]|uniref:winged helix-turn-helix transcriptional regulator n=1 Tax=Haloprofundus salinisoli TaxID=2876193 RepID=UPI001CD02DD6|nr:helix-turn-helix domain-containing protein [Haloprofundus salinisoli]